MLTDEQVAFYKADEGVCGHLADNWLAYDKLARMMENFETQYQMDVIQRYRQLKLIIEDTKIKLGITAFAETRKVDEDYLIDQLARLVFHLEQFYDVRVTVDNKETLECPTA